MEVRQPPTENLQSLRSDAVNLDGSLLKSQADGLLPLPMKR